MMTNVELINIGDELLIGQIVNTNATWIGQQLSLSGYWLKQITTIGDNEQEIVDALNAAMSRAQIILITGGLGPTKDDLTKDVLCKYFNTQLVFNEQAYSDIENIFHARGKAVTETNKRQAELPAACIPIYNKKGTAPGMWFNHGEQVFVSMPGVPFEMQAMMQNDVLPKLRQLYESMPLVHKTILTQGIGESDLSDRIAAWENDLPAHLKLAYLPAAGMVRLRLTGKGVEHMEQDMNLRIDKLKELIAPYIFGYDDDTIQSVVGKLLTEKQKTLSVAESCTGGFLAHLITSIPGSSTYFMGGTVSYSNAAKMSQLHVSEQSLKEYGAVSEAVAIEMAIGARKTYNTDFALSTTGIAGPGGGSLEKPIGTVWIGVATHDACFAKKFMLGTNRLRIIQVAADTALNMLRKKINEHN
ncbi:MAG TPA: competence/damage-inducible protein A [Bacteroidia bacterium]|nr:competence/damage-inducible protein A [Bacteroidia bacterium]HQW17142.1 competence/damage-inducible protein A [Bacteroidia bacterium]HQW50001.1 competence/damage-inducible protein A [Bacteroidia bacterium]HQX70159.1 competence/damage-inducible protein A [Bacteroidia bacterium]HQZ76472.1 competence/damage-inducible protein A [Bacteroidia bacterium]